MRLPLVLLALANVGCASSLSTAEDHFGHDELPEARRELVLLEPEYCHFSRRERLDYALWRGLTELALGHARYAAVWLGRAKLSLDREPELFDDERRGRLLAAWQSLGYMPGEPGRLLPGVPRCST